VRFLGDRLQNASPYAIGQLSVLSCLSVCDVGVLWQTAGWIKMPLGMEVGLGRGHIVLCEDPAVPLPGKEHSPPQFSAVSFVAKRLDGWRCHVVGEVGLGLGDIVVDEDPSPL